MKSISIIGGDLRQTTLAKLLQKDGYDICIYGFDKDIENSGLNLTNDLHKALTYEVIILPVPISYDGININAPFSKKDISLDYILSNISSNKIILGGKFSENVIEILKSKSIPFFDYLNREELSIKNAIATAEGAIEIAIAETPITLWGSKCLILGYGRIGKVLSKMLGGLGTKLSVCARKCSDIAWIEERGYTSIYTDKLEENIGDFDIIFNTVPALILNRDILKKAKNDALIIDLASKPGGADIKLG